MKRGFIFFLLLCSILTTSLIAQAQSAQSDFDADGNSDFPMISIGSDKVLNWSVHNSTTNAQSSLGSLGLNGDHVILARWKGSTLPQLGVVTIGSDSKTIVWKVKNDQGVEEQREFGQKKFTVVSGGDFDGDGVTDAAIAILKGKKVNWQVAFGLFNTLVGQENISKVAFGEAGDRIFFASPDGLNDWLGTLGKGPAKGVIMRAKNLKTGAVISSSKFPDYAIQGTRPRPFPIKQDNGIDLLALAKPQGANTKVEIFTFEGVKVASVILPGKGDIVVGNFTAAAGEEIAIKTSSGFTIFSYSSGATTTVATANGIAVDEININNITTTSSNPGDGGDDDDDDDSGAPPSGGNSACSSVTSWPSSHIYKTRGSDHFSDIRRNTSGVIVKPGGRGPFPSCVSAVDTKGKVIANFGLYARGNGWEARYYAGIGCGSSTPYGGSTIAGKAKSSSGSSYVYMNFGSVCYGPIDPARCIGSSSC